MNEKSFEGKIFDEKSKPVKTAEKNELREPTKEKVLQKQLGEIRKKVHREMEKEIKERLENNPKPTEKEIRMAAFKEELEPQVRDAVPEFYKKGYSTKSSGFYGEKSEFQAIDGYFYVDENTKKNIEKLGAQVLRGPDIGVPENKYIAQIRFYPEEANLQKIKQKWDTIANVLPKIAGPEPVCDRAEEFRKQYAPNHPNLEQKILDYFEWLKIKCDEKNKEASNNKMNEEKEIEKVRQELLKKYDKNMK